MASIFKQKNKNLFLATIKLPDKDGNLVWGQVSTACKTKQCAERVGSLLEEAALSTLEGKPLERTELVKRLVRASEYPRNSKLTPAKAEKLVDKVFPGGSSGFSLTLRQVFDKYAKASDISSRRYGNIERAVTMFEQWAGKKAKSSISSFRVSDLQEYYNWVAENGGVGIRTLNVTLGNLGCLWNFAIAQEFASRNPCLGVKKKQGKAMKREAFSEADIQLLLKYFRELDQNDAIDRYRKAGSDWHMLFLLGLCAAPRITDAVGMKRKNIITMDGFMYLSWVEGKTENTRTIPIVEPLLSLIKERIAELEPDDFLCPSLQKVHGHYGTSSVFVEHCQKAGVDVGEEITPAGRRWVRKSYHSLRKTLNSSIIGSGVEHVVAQKLLGHLSADVNSEHYLSLGRDTQVAALEAGMQKLGVN